MVSRQIKMAALVVMMVLATLVLEPRWLNEAGASERFLAAASPTTTRKVVTDSWVKQRLDHFNPADTRAWNQVGATDTAFILLIMSCSINKYSQNVMKIHTECIKGSQLILPLFVVLSQRYFRNDEYYRDGGPLFIFVGGEEPMKTSWLEDSHMMSLAKTYGAAAFFLEHRFYGSSRPTEDVSTQSLAYLTAEQALADLADFVVGVRGKSGAKVVLFGRSYAGSLAAWSRLKYPHLVDGAVASSAPVLAKANFYEFFYGITIELQEESPECIANIRAATTEMKLLLTAEGGPQKLTQLFR
ncbi:hypothetical protein PR048_022357 [Dryococelus australis]|uniref:Serine protease K12H4.7 n=1 Tax=Dryococelus australis TaxID=614101 RepID=A0ABQ9H126_9NEOP|nr:hypothetical protein PR048_022357 [Dryococelus australis]